MAKKEKSIVDFTDEEIGLTFLDVKDTEKECKDEISVLREDITRRLDDHGIPMGVHFKIQAGSIELKKEIRQSLEVIQDKAVALLELNNLEDMIDATATIAVKVGVDTKKVPAKLLKDMEKYFDITMHKSVTKDALQSLLLSNKIKEKDFEKIINTKESFAIKVSKK